MKNKFIIITALIFVAGLLICGIGGGIFFAEMKSFEVVEGKNSDTYVTDEIDLTIPSDNSPIYYSPNSPLMDSMTIEKDETLPKGKAIFVISHLPRHYDFKISLLTHLYVWNSYEKYISEHSVNYLNGFSYCTNVGNDLERLKEVLSDIKERKIYEQDDDEIKVVLKVNPEDEGRFMKIADGSWVITYDEYLNEYKEDEYKTESEEEAVAPSSDNMVYSSPDNTVYPSPDNTAYYNGSIRKLYSK